MTNESIPVNCGKCPSCIKRRISQWSFRLRKEALRSISAHFVTLTYDTDNVPLTNKGYMTLNTRDMELFFKKLRKQEDKRGVKIKYFYVGEYGGKTNRPHYHAIVYNADANTIDKIWDKGQTHFGEVNGASIGYALKYMIKTSKIPAHRNDDRMPEFARMSKGLGENYLTEKILNFHKEKEVLLERQFVTLDGKKLSMARYYKDKIYTEYEKKLIQFNAKKIAEEETEIDVQRQIEAHKQQFSKQKIDKLKNQKI